MPRLTEQDRRLTFSRTSGSPFRTKKNRSLELTSVYHECTPGRRKLAVKVVDIFGNDTMTNRVEVTM